MRRLGPQDQIATMIEMAETPVPSDVEEERQPPQSTREAATMLVDAFGPTQTENVDASPTMTRLMGEFDRVRAEREAGVRTLSASERVQQHDPRLPRSGNKFQMARDWEPDDVQRRRK